MNWPDMIVRMLGGTWVTVKIFVLTIGFSIPLGFLLTMLVVGKHKLLKKAAGYYILVLRGTPLLLQMFFIYYGLPFLPGVGPYLRFDRFFACVIAFVLNYAAYFAEIFRGGLLAVDIGQFEAAKVLGFSSLQTKVKIVIPQMIKVVLPAVSNEAIILVKDTALITVLGQSELLTVTQSIVNAKANLIPFVVAAAFYLVMSWLLTKLFQWLEEKYMF